MFNEENAPKVNITQVLDRLRKESDYARDMGHFERAAALREARVIIETEIHKSTRTVHQTPIFDTDLQKIVLR